MLEISHMTLVPQGSCLIADEKMLDHKGQGESEHTSLAWPAMSLLPSVTLPVSCHASPQLSASLIRLSIKYSLPRV